VNIIIGVNHELSNYVSLLRWRKHLRLMESLSTEVSSPRHITNAWTA